ncbi:uncharacterized protein LDX57_011110 [Aspergillus melleus]|uniref:uncharacterized protein n=1 Tax=Aspergillus melleus TaxID=138277 RepID=UPI001E8E8AFB|nr:uncharacterized protein LDX57_011110 [Aspergillus melleus]KAH8433476.1 hypothetical protein LDX57_011110 [Aspergillus melleus]
MLVDGLWMLGTESSMYVEYVKSSLLVAYVQEYKETLEHLDQQTLVELLSKASDPLFDASRKLEEQVKLLGK